MPMQTMRIAISGLRINGLCFQNTSFSPCLNVSERRGESITCKRMPHTLILARLCSAILFPVERRSCP